MTFRAKPVVKRAHRPAWEAQDRRSFYLNLGFGLIVLLAVLILAIAGGLSWYNEHLSPVGSVDGDNITRDDYNARLRVDNWRLDEAEARARTAVLAGHLTEAQGTAQEQTIAQQRQSLTSSALERLIDAKLQAKLAGQEGVTATPQDIDGQLVVEATTPESRHAWVIEVKPVTDLGAVSPSASEKATAKANRAAEMVSRERVDVVVIDVGQSPAIARTIAAVSALAQPVGIVIVDESPARLRRPPVLAKWGPFDDLFAAIESADQERGKWGALA